nr:ribonuclease H-like domain-containing protein [Tanacetum cinerariifolium]
MIKVLPPKTVEEVMARERERKVRTTLLMALPEDHLAKFHKMADAKEIAPQLDYDDLEQINDDDIEEIDLKWQVSIISMRIKKFHKRKGKKLQFDTKDPVGFDKTKVECFNFHKMGHFVRDCRAKGTKTAEEEMLEDIDWYGHVKEDAQNYAMMAYSSSNSGNYMSSGPDVEIDYSKFNYGPKQTSADESDSKPSEYDSFESDYNVETITSMPEPVENTPKVVCETKVWTDAPIIEEYESDSDNDSMSHVQKDKEKPSFAFTDSVKHVKTSGENVKETSTPNHIPKIEKQDRNGYTRKGLGYAFIRKACFVCGSFSHLIRDYDFHEKRMAKQAALTKSKNKATCQRENRPVWNNVQRVDHQNKFVPSVVLTKTGRLKSEMAWVPKRNYFLLFHVENDPYRALKDKGIVDSGCSKHMTGNKAHLADYQEFKGGSVAFEGSNRRITGKGKIKAGRLDFKDVYYMEELKHYNLFFVSQICDKKNKVIFTDTDCLVMSPDFKLSDEDQKGKQHKASCKAKTMNSMNQPLQILHMDLFGPTSIKREYSNARTPQQNKVAERKNRTLIEAARTMVLVTKPQNKTPYELLIEEIDFHEEHFILPIRSAYSTTVKSSRDKIEKTTYFKTCEKPVSQVEQIFLEELEKLKRQEKEVNDAARKETTHENQDAHTNNINLLNDVSTPFSTAGPSRAFNDGVVTDFNNLETTMNVSPTPTTRIHNIHPKTQILGDPMSAIQTRSKVNKNFKAHALVKQKEYGIFIIQDKYVAEILKKFDFLSVKTAITLIETQKPLVKDEEAADVDVHLYSKELASPKQTALGKDNLNSLIVNSLLKTIWLSMHHVIAMKHWLFQCKQKLAKVSVVVLIEAQHHISNKSPLSGVNTPRCDEGSLEHYGIDGFLSTNLMRKIELELLLANDVVKLRALIDGKRVVISEDVIQQDLRLDDADGVEYLPNEELFTELTRMGYEKPPPNTKRTAWNEFSCSMASAIICLATGRKFNFSKYIFDSMVRNVDSPNKFLMYPRFLQVIINAQVDDLSSHTTRYTSHALTQKVFANMRRVDDVEVPAAPTPPSPTIAPSPAPQDPIPIPLQAQHAPPSSPPLEQQPKTFESSMTLLNTMMETCAILSQKVAQLEQDKIAQALEILKLKKRVMKLEKKISKSSGLKRLRKVGVRIEAIDADEDITLVDAKTQVDVEPQGRKDDDNDAIKEVSAVEPTVFDDEEVTMTMAHTLIKMKVEKARLFDEQMAKRLHDEEENIDWNAVVEQMQEKRLDNIRKYQSLKGKPISIAQARKNMIVYLNNMVGYKMEHFRDEEPTKKRVAEETLLQESFKKLKVVEVSGSESTQDTPTNDPKEISGEDVQNMLEIISVFEFKVEALLVKEYLVALWRLVKEKFSSAVPTIDKEKALCVKLKRLLEQDTNDVIWKLQKYMHYPIEWKLYSNCGVHQVSTTTRRHDMYMLTEKDYPLSNGVMALMLSIKLQVEEDSKMAEEDPFQETHKTITKASVRRHLKLADVDGISTLPTTNIFEQLALMGATTTASSLEVEQGSGNISKTQTKATPSRPSSPITSSKGGLECHVTIGDSPVQARPERLSNLPNEPPLREDKVTSLENELTSIKAVYNKALITLTKKVKKLETKLKHKRRRAVIDSSKNEEAKGDDTASPQTDDDETLAETLLNIKRSAAKDKGKAIMQESEPPKKIKKKEMIQISLDEEIAQRKFVPMESEGQKANSKAGEGSLKEGESIKRPAEEEKEKKKDAESLKQIEEEIIQQEDVVAKQVMEESSKKAGGRLKRKTSKAKEDKDKRQKKSG